MRCTILPILFSLLLGTSPAVSAEEARPVFLNSAEILGVCGDQVLFYGEEKPRVQSGLYSTNGVTFRLIRDFFKQDALIMSPWQKIEQDPQLVGLVPLSFSKGGVPAFLTACTTPKSVRVIQRNLVPYFGDNSIVRDNNLIFGQVYPRKTQLFRLSGGVLTSLGAAPSKRPDGDEEGRTFLYKAKNAIVFTVNDAKTALSTFWRTVNSGVRRLHDFAELVADGLKGLSVGFAIETGDGRVAFVVSGREVTGRPRSFYYHTDGEITQQIALPPFSKVLEH